LKTGIGDAIKITSNQLQLKKKGKIVFNKTCA
jgi:hypothetical protein